MCYIPKYQLFLLMKHWFCSVLPSGKGMLEPAGGSQMFLPCALGSTAGLGTLQCLEAAASRGKGINMKMFSLKMKVMDTRVCVFLFRLDSERWETAWLPAGD